MMDAHTNAIGRKDAKPPRPGDLGVCFGCFETLVFDDDLKLREPEPHVIASIPDDMVMKLRAMKTMKQLVEMNRPKRRETRQ
jgi:hypothetical protein